jgi:cytochrome c nitrite reductase small subunit
LNDRLNLNMKMPRVAILLIVLLAVVIGIGAFTFKYGKGLSYFSANPEACQNCHIMRPQFDSWQKASHHTAATCVDCHLPHDFIGKYLAKAENGYNHSKAFTLQNFHEPIMITPKNSRILQNNCLVCHQRMIANIQDQAHANTEGMMCVHCHITVGHGERTGLGGPLLADEYKEIESD